jgi:glycosyltransferase involved in cell wall biosynthesis
MSEIIAERMRPRTAGRPVRALAHLTSGGPIPSPAPRAPAGDRELRVTFLGRLASQKRADWLVEQWPQLARDRPVAPARLDVYGTDPGGRELNRLRGWVRANALESSVCLHGPYASADLPAILARTDLVVLPSTWEGLPQVLIEAMLHGVPFVATDAGGTAELANADAEVTPMDLTQVAGGITRMAQRLRDGRIDAGRLFRWADARYGYTVVAGQWRRALLTPREFFAAGP